MGSHLVRVASHNIMHGYRLERLLETYREMRDLRLDILCLQENRCDQGAWHADRIAEVFDFCTCAAHFQGGVAVLHHRRLTCGEHVIVPLPVLPALRPVERLYIAGGCVDHRFALLASFRFEDGTPVTVVNLHLDSAGTNHHRRRQVEVVSESLRTHHLVDNVIACGDTNVFSWFPSRHAKALAWVLEPLGDYGITLEPSGAPTHFFARADEPLLTHQVARFFGRIGLDLPRRFDVVCSGLASVHHGQVSTPDSDHDLVWLEVATPRGLP